MKELSRRCMMIVPMCILLIACPLIFAIGDPPPKPSGTEKQAGHILIVVNGRTLTGPNSSGRIVNGRIVIPMASVARAFGDSISASPRDRSVTVIRQGGISATFDARLGQVRENGSAVLTVSIAGEMVIPLDPDALMLPIEVAAALFDASIRSDPEQNKVLITRGQIDAGVSKENSKAGPFDIYQAEYEYGLNMYSGALAQSLVLNVTGRIGDGRFHFNSNSSGPSFRQFSPRNFSLNVERPNGQRFTAGDFGAGAALPLLTANVRGAFASIPAGSFTIAAFGGRTNSGTLLPESFGEAFPPVPFRPRSGFDTNVFGGYVSSANEHATDPLSWSAGVMRFSGARRSGTLTSTNISYTGARLRMQGDVGIGNFRGLDAEGRTVGGLGTALDLAATYQVADSLSVQGRYASIGRNFLSPQSGVREPIDLKAGGVSWSPSKWLSTSLNASTMKRPGQAGRSDSYMTASFAVSPGGGKPRFYVSHTQSSSRLIRSGAFTIVNASKEFSRFHLFANATRIKNIGPAHTNAQFGAKFRLNEMNSLEVSHGIGSGRNLNGLIDWRRSGLFGDRLSFSGGGGYSYSKNGKISTFERVTASLKLPARSSLQVSYINTNSGPTLLVQIKGTLFRKRESGAYLNAPIAEAKSFGSISGRTYQDVDGNGIYDAGTDRPQAGVKIRVDGNRYVESDANGIYRFDALRSGEHKVYLDLVSVRADLTLLNIGARELTINGGQAATVDFRLVRTGRITGRVWLDANGNGKFDDGEMPLADVRIVTASLRDTLTDADGSFTIADLVPGEHVVFIDEKTLPEMTVSASKPFTVHVFAGLETPGLDLSVIRVPAEVKRFQPKPR